MTTLQTWRGFKISPLNKPLAKPGVYGLLCLPTQKWYIGVSCNVARRVPEHPLGCTRLANAFRLYGRKNFLAVPLFYATTPDFGWLLLLELDLIKTYNSIENGYNVVGTLGRSLFTHYDFREFMCTVMRSPEVREKISLARQRVCATTDWGVRHATFIKPFMEALHQTPKRKQQLQAQLKKRWAAKETRVAYGKLISKLKWVTDGKENKRIVDATPPFGWQFGRTFHKVWSRKEVSCRPGAQARASAKSKEAVARRNFGK